MRTDIFIDGIGACHLLAGAARIELHSLIADPAGDAGQVLAVPRLRLVMAPETFATLRAGMAGLIQQFEARGLLRRVEPAAEGSASDAA